ncbi:unnamed protein product [Notodromas monacha]|uniref:RNA exonuclease 4 n=1 Tax=Notodromas monacha TaxID=399045 RepID=A0A7R9G9W7_9CRUS|nr:unnamed protein product [Notodromas monacha]CAG0913061.1 unnamed protein product [Notodromas monacha]
MTNFEADVLTKCLAIDCEMVGVGTPEMERSILARVSIVNEKNECVYDKYVRPSEEVTNYRTHVSGVTSSHLLHAEEYSTVRREVAALIHKRVLVGHSLKNDFAVLLLSHPKHLIRDTSTYPEFRKLFDGKTPSLKNLTDRLLDVKIQHGIHDSVEDAIAAMTLYKQYAKEWEASQRGCKVRQEITKRISEEGEMLQAREKQLLRQVDVASAHFMSVYLVHHAQLHQLVGIAQSFFARYANETNLEENDIAFEKDAADLLDKIRTGLKQCDLTNEDTTKIPIAVTFPDNAVKELEKMIQDFGEIDAGSAFLMSFKNSDGDKKGLGFLPYGHEDYLDSELEVLQTKPLLGSPSLIRFPKKMHVIPNHTGLSLDDRNRWLLQRLKEPELPKPQNIETWLQTMKNDVTHKKSESSCSDSIEILGNLDDDVAYPCKDDVCEVENRSQWAEDGEFMMLKMFCKKEPVCKQLEDCCGLTSGGCCVKKALNKEALAVPMVNINNRSLSRSANWLLTKKHNQEAEQINTVEPLQWKPDAAAASAWKSNVSKHWEKIWNDDNETWLIRRKRLEKAANEIISSESPSEPIECPSVDDAQILDCTDSFKFGEIHEKIKNADHKIWRLQENIIAQDGGKFFAELSALREEKAKKSQWISTGSPAVSSTGPINYKTWLAPACNASPHQEKFLTPLANPNLILKRNVFPANWNIQKGAGNVSWLLKKE